jgi:uncharacterized membrane protein
MCYAQAADVFSTGIVGGGFLMGAIAVHPAAEALAASPHVRFRQELIRRLARLWPPFMLAPLVAAPLALTFCVGAIASSFDLVGLLLSLTTVGITVSINAPLNRRFARWSDDAFPLDWHEQIARWNTAHALRMATSLGAFACAIVAGG